MAKYRVEVYETVTATRQTVIEAESADDARQMAEEQDWREWELVDDSADCDITSIELMEQ